MRNILRKIIIRGERLIKLGNSWFFAKFIKVKYIIVDKKGKVLSFTTELMFLFNDRVN